MTQTFYRRELPPTVTSFSSIEGREIFASAMAHGGTRSFFALIEQLQTQPETAFCGMTTLVIVLNALAVDPRRLWKGPWRWYEENMLNCCVDLRKVKESGITFSTFVCLAKCQGLQVQATRGSESTVDQFRQVVRELCTTPPVQNAHPTSFLVVSYTRQVIGQTGTGHFSPIGAYDKSSDCILLLDTARFKYGIHWIPLELMFQALLPVDPSTGASRGYIVLSYDREDCKRDKMKPSENFMHLPRSVLFRCQNATATVKEYKQFIKQQDADKIDLGSVISFWTRNQSDSELILELAKPQLQPVDSAEIKMVKSLQLLVRMLIREIDESITAEDQPDKRLHDPSNECCSTLTQNLSQRLIKMSIVEIIFIVYLASLSEKARKDVINRFMPNSLVCDDAVVGQLFSEAALISYAIQTCDLEF